MAKQLAEVVKQMEATGLAHDVVLDGIELGLQKLRGEQAKKLP